MTGEQQPGSAGTLAAADGRPTAQQRGGGRRRMARQRGGWQRADWPAVAAAALVVVANVLALSSFRLPFIGPAIGFWFLVLHPAYLLFTSRLWRGCSAAEGVGYSVAGVLLLLMVGALGANALLPLAGVQRPLDPVPVVVLGDLLTLSLYVLRRRQPGHKPRWALIRTLGIREGRLLAGSALGVVLAVLAANRLNNGAGDTVGIVALAVMAATLVLLLWWQAGVRDSVVSLTLYAVSLGVLLMTSLRGWSVTGHDIQREYLVFQLTAAHGHWSMSYFQDAYNACLSITILPTLISQVVHVAGPYVFKVFFQLLFALSPVLVYTLARRYWSKPISILSAVYFVALPTFFTDMPFLNRQEIAFLFIGVAVLAITNTEWGLWRRRLIFLGAALGVELSHYSSMYLFLATLLIAWLARLVLSVDLRRVWRRLGRRDSGKPSWADSWASKARTVGGGSVLALAATTFVWVQLITHTAGSVVAAAQAAIAGLTGGNGTRSGDLANILFSGSTPSLQTVLGNYQQAAFAQRALSPSLYVPAADVLRYPTPLANGLAPAPLTALGHFLAGLGLSPSFVNGFIRNAAAKDEQLFVIIGFAAIMLMSSLRGRLGREVFSVSVGSMTILGAIIVFPGLSVDYGVLRAFEQALIVIAPILVVGSIVIFSPFGEKWALRIASVLCLTIFVSTTGLLPQILGGYPPQLSLNNSGQYYDIYYMHPQEEAAVGWLGSEPGVLSDGVQASFDPYRFAFTTGSQATGMEHVGDIYPPLVQQNSWVIVGDSTMVTGRSAFFYDGDLVTYLYPRGFLQNSKNLVYSNGGTEIYK